MSHEPPKDPHHYYLERWRVYVLSVIEAAWDAEKVAADFGKLGLQTSFLLNGGALALLPTMMQWLSDDKRAHVPQDAKWFVYGLICAALATVTAYLNYTFIGRSRRYEATASAHEINAQIFGRDATKDIDRIEAARLEKRWDRATNVSAWLALVFGVASYGFFLWGAVGLVSLAGSLGPHPTHHSALAGVAYLPSPSSPRIK